ncbi:histidine kinase [Rhodoferax sp.]|uniref:histidine kinase n=1 Tax=Rhodoferax sp. TaxID=50421 RepID=UPI00274ED41D|nr:histidine kinase [Rhodoferax sp.]
MFKAIGDLIYKTPWWGLILGGVLTLGLLVMFALPIHVIRLTDSGSTPAENRAIQREINLAFGDRALNLAKGVVSAIKERTTEPERQRELDRALAEIERARQELIRAENHVNEAVRENAREAADSALETATNAAESALEAAVQAREAVEEAKNDAMERLRDKGVDVSIALKTFEQLVVSARDNEQAARESLAAMRAVRREGDHAVRPAIPPPLVAPQAPGAPALVLPPEVRGDIRAKIGSDVWRVAVGSALILAFMPLFIVLLIVKLFIGRSRRALALADRKTREAEQSDVSRQVTEARLQALQAQVEPHFLYNTLANVQALNEVDPPAANQMVGHLIEYLRASLPKMRESTSTVGQELDLVRAYLNILQMRMGSRLVFDINAPVDVLACAFPPMMLPSLVENAIKHGLEPQREGGRIEVLVDRLPESGGESLRVQVRDTGRGLSDTPVQAGGGVGLTNLRERLQAIYGAKGRFSLVSNEPKGAVAMIEVPLQTSAQYQSEQGQGNNPVAVAASPMVRPKGWRRVWYATSKTHSVWATLLARLFIVLMIGLAGLLLLAFVGLVTGWLPVHLGDLQLDGIEGLAIGSVGLLIGFGAMALALAIAVAVLYGLGFLFAALLVFVPTVILIFLFPMLSPFILIGLGLWWLFKRRRVRNTA